MQEIKITLRYTLPKRVCKRLKVILRYTLPKRARKIEFTLIYIRRPLFDWTLSFDWKLRHPPSTYIIIILYLFPNVFVKLGYFWLTSLQFPMIFRLEAFPTQSVRWRAIWFTASTTRLCFETSRIHLLDFSLSNYSGTETTWRYDMHVVWLPGVERIFSSLRPGSGE